MTYMLNDLTSFDISNNQMTVIKSSEHTAQALLEPNRPPCQILRVATFGGVITCSVVVVAEVIDDMRSDVLRNFVTFKSGWKLSSGTGTTGSKFLSSPDDSPESSKSLD